MCSNLKRNPIVYFPDFSECCLLLKEFICNQMIDICWSMELIEPQAGFKICNKGSMADSRYFLRRDDQNNPKRPSPFVNYCIWPCLVLKDSRVLSKGAFC